MSLLQALRTLFRHRWLDQRHARRAISVEASQRLHKAIVASERLHTAEIRMVVEAALPLSYVWRHVWHGRSLAQVVRERALMLFGKLRLWDTEHNNGVLIYLLLAEQRIELVVDRGLKHSLSPEVAQSLVRDLGVCLRSGQFEAGLQQALNQVSDVLVRDFGVQPEQARSNELPDAVVLL